jgi:hypothetical protein
MNLFRERIKECLETAKIFYGEFIKIPQSTDIIVNKEFMLPSWMAYESQPHNLNIVSFNAKWVRYNEELYIGEIIPHELAHVICRVNPVLHSENDHCSNWEELCRVMGGSGEKYIDEKLIRTG